MHEGKVTFQIKVTSHEKNNFQTIVDEGALNYVMSISIINPLLSNFRKSKSRVMSKSGVHPVYF